MMTMSKNSGMGSGRSVASVSGQFSVEKSKAKSLKIQGRLPQSKTG
jgi:hypothetical protein